MPRIISLVVLIAIVLLFGLLFYQVMIGFLMPIFIAVLTAVLFQSVFDWLLPRLKNSRPLAALTTTLLVFLLIMLPTVLVGFKAWGEANKLYVKFNTFKIDRQHQNEVKNDAIAASQLNNTDAPGNQSITASPSTKSLTDQPSTAKDSESLQIYTEALDKAVTFINEKFGLELKTLEVQQTITSHVNSWLAPVAQTTAGVFMSFITGLVIMLIALYYFLLDGEEMIAGIGKLLPVDSAYQRTFLHEFAQVSRAVATATLVSAIAQGFLGGIGYYFAGLNSIWLLVIATMFASLVPFVGATLVWIPCCIYLFYFKGNLPGAIFLAIYGFGVVSMVDNFVKPWILQGRTKLHPLLALLSVLGGVQALGPIGIFVGPMAVVFFQAALVMLQSELKKDPAGLYKTTPTPNITS